MLMIPLPDLTEPILAAHCAQHDFDDIGQPFNLSRCFVCTPQAQVGGPSLPQKVQASRLESNTAMRVWRSHGRQSNRLMRRSHGRTLKSQSIQLSGSWVLGLVLAYVFVERPPEFRVQHLQHGLELRLTF